MPDVLTEAELRVVDLVGHGLTNHEIAAALGLSPKTVEWTLTNVYRKLRVRSRTELALAVERKRYALRQRRDTPDVSQPEGS